jgi:hypothetical protein
MHFCIDGYLVDERGWVPTRAEDYNWVHLGQVVGCSNLRCESCHERVRQAPGFVEPSQPAAVVFEALGRPDPSTVLTRHPDGFGRLYACSCFVLRVAAQFQSVAEPLDPITETRAPWSCAGHPVLVLPADLDGVAVSSSTNLVALARGTAGGTIATQVPPAFAAVRGFFLLRLFHLVDDPPLREAISRAVAAVLDDGDARVRVAALGFFQIAFAAAGAERVAELARDRIDLFVGVPDPDGGPSLFDRLLEVLESRMRSGAGGAPRDPNALEQVKQLALRPPGIGGVVYSLVREHQDWLADNAAAMIQAAPAQWTGVIHALADAPTEKLTELANLVVRQGYARADEVIEVAHRYLSEEAQKSVRAAVAAPVA